MAKCPVYVPPCLPRAVKSIPTSRDWIHQPKLDGFRMQVVKDGDDIKLYTKNGADWSKRLAFLISDLGQIPARTGVFDCELVFVNKEGRIDFLGLFGGSQTRSYGPSLFAFDLLYHGGHYGGGLKS